jgi:RHS repeat-associated protein
VNGGGFCCDDAPGLRAGAIGNGNDNPEIYQYYYHSDHLGSTSLITNLNGGVVQHVEYVPFGEVFIEERNNRWNTPYLFNAKELDEETGLYYYGARYYDSRNSVFLGVDPMWEKYPGISSYAYCLNNPVRFTDPTGREVDLSGMSEEERKKYESQIAEHKQASDLFNTMYSSLESSKNVFTVQFGQTTSEGTSEPVFGQFSPNESGGGSVTFLPTSTDIVGDVLSEEFFHAYQHENKSGYGQGEFNVEFEAKVFNIAVDAESGRGFADYDGMGNFQSNVFLGNYGSGLQVITPTNVISNGF